MTNREYRNKVRMEKLVEYLIESGYDIVTAEELAEEYLQRKGEKG